MVDPIADMLARINNALAVRHGEITLPHSRIKSDILQVLKRDGWIVDFKTDDSEQFKTLVVTLFSEGTNSPITGLERVSKPGRRVHVTKADIPRVLGGRGDVVVSTSGGIMSGKRARRESLGGEVICKVW